MKDFSGDYELHKTKTRERQAELSKQGRDIGPIPPVADPTRRDSCRDSLRLFCETYLPAIFYLGWSDDHLTAIAQIEQTVLHGGQFALAMPRGSGKTSLLTAAILWATLFTHRRYAVVVSHDAPRAKQIMQTIKYCLANDQNFILDFPEVCVPFSKLENISIRAQGQLSEGKPTNLAWRENMVSFPNTAHDGIIESVGIEGSIRGKGQIGHNGDTIRPDLALLDDPQNEGTAYSVSEVSSRLKIINGAVLGMAGPDKTIAAFAALTVIAPGDLATQLLDTTKSPLWQGQTCKLVYEFPTNTALWDEYKNLYFSSRIKAQKFYKRNRAAMDAGARVAWPERFDRQNEISAIQHAMNLLIRDESAFWAEYQNEPKLNSDGKLIISPESIQTNGLKMGVRPPEAAFTVAYIDVQKHILFWTVAAFRQDFTGYVLDYGSFPEQPRDFTIKNLPVKLGDKLPTVNSVDGRISTALEGTIKFLQQKYQPDRILIDSGYKPGLVKAVIRKFASPTIHPSKGDGITASGNPMSEWKRKPGEIFGHCWVVRADKSVVIDTNSWKTHLAESLNTKIGEKGNISLYGTNILKHKFFLSHFSAEYAIETHGRGRDLYEWRERPGAADNHWFDCLTGCCVAASMCGASTDSQKPEAPPAARKTYTAADLKNKFSKF